MKNATLEKLARDQVGDGRSNLIFVTVGADVRAVFVGKKCLDDALDYAQGIQDNLSIAVEDSSGVVWESD